MTAIDTVVTVVFCLLAALVVWRWPVQTLLMTVGLPVAAVAWTVVGPWAGWTGLGLTVAAMAVWSVCDGDDRVGRPAARALMARPATCIWLVFLTSLALSLWAPTDRLAWIALVVALVTGGWLAWTTLRPTSTPPVLALPDADGRRRMLGRRSARLDGFLAGTELLDGDRQPLERARHLVASGWCPRSWCGGTLVATVPVPEPGGVDVGHLVARAACPICGARAVGVIDPARGPGEAVWLELPPPEADERMEGIA